MSDERVTKLNEEESRLYIELMSLESRRQEILVRLNELSKPRRVAEGEDPVPRDEDGRPVLVKGRDGLPMEPIPGQQTYVSFTSGEPPTDAIMMPFFEADPAYVWRLKDLRDQIEGGGWDNCSYGAIRVALYRAVQEGRIERVGHGRYRLAKEVTERS